MKGMIVDAVALSGVGLSGYGAWLISPGLLWMLCGLTLILGGLWYASNGNPRTPQQ